MFCACNVEVYGDDYYGSVEACLEVVEEAGVGCNSCEADELETSTTTTPTRTGRSVGGRWPRARWTSNGALQWWPGSRAVTTWY
jgi:hypothetical protein